MTTKPTPLERMAAAHAATEREHDATRQQELARLFRPDERLERLIDLQVRDPSAFARFGPTTRISLGLYKQQCDAAGYGGNDDGDSAA